MKKLVLCLVCFMLLMSTGTSDAIAIDGNKIISSDLTIVNKKLNDIGYLGGKSEVFILHDSKERPSFLLGTSEKGYVILDRLTQEIYEYGENNPYVNCFEEKKYYSGPLNYYERNISGYKNLRTNVTRDNIPNLNYVIPIQNENTIKQIVPDDGGSSVVKVSNSYAYINRKSFGYNTDNTCSAVAVAITLNYLTLQTGKNFVPVSWKSENLTSNKFDVSTYPKAHSLHRYLVDSCGMGAASFGQTIKLPFELYVSSKVSSTYNLKLSFSIIPSATSIKNSINANKPVVVSTAATSDEYSYHSMVAYGYRAVTDRTMLLVHTGWYSNIKNESGIYAHSDVYINSGFVACAHYFSYN